MQTGREAFAESYKVGVARVGTELATLRKGSLLDISTSVFIMCVRWLIFWGVVLRFSITYNEYGPLFLDFWALALLALFAHTARITWYTLTKSEEQRDKGWHRRQILVDTLMFSWLDLITQQPDSDFFLFYFVPLLIISDYFERRETVWLFGLVSLIFSITMLVLSISSSRTLTELLFRNILPRWTFFMVIPFFVLRQRNRLRVHTSELEAVHKNALNIAEKVALRPRLDAIVEAATELLHAKGCKVYLPLPQQDMLELVKLKGIKDEKFKESYILPFHQGMAGKVMTNQESLIENDYPGSPYCVPELAHLFEAVIEVPLLFGDEAIGVLGVFDDAKQRKFTNQDVEVLERLARHVAVAIHEVQLYEQQEKQARALAALHDAGVAVNATLNMHDTLDALAEHAWKLARVDNNHPPLHTTVSLLEERTRLRIRAAYRTSELTPLRERVGVIELEGDGPIGIVGKAIKNSASQLIPDVTREPDYINYNPHTRSQLAIPIKYGDDIIGVISVEHEKHFAYSEELQKNMELLATHAAAAIDNIELFENRTELAVIGLGQSTSQHDTRGKAINILDAYQDVEGIMQSCLDNPPVIPRQSLVKLRDTIVEINQIADEICDLNQPISPPSRDLGRLIPINKWLESQSFKYQDDNRGRIDEISLKLDLDDADQCYIDPDWFARACSQLVLNARKAMSDSPERYLTISTRRVGSYFEIAFSDTGDGISEEVGHSLFKRRIRDTNGSGMGLLMAELIVRTYGGAIVVLKPGPGDTTIAIYLPIDEESASSLG